jgi:hypothetical protein
MKRSFVEGVSSTGSSMTDRMGFAARALAALALFTATLLACGKGSGAPSADTGITYSVGGKSGTALKVAHADITQFSDHTLANVILNCPAFNGAAAG